MSAGSPAIVSVMPITAARQRNAVSEGIALGLLMLGYDSLPLDKVRVDLAFGGAWRAWSYRGCFPRVGTDLRNGSDGVWVMTHATESRHSWLFYWDTRQGVLSIMYRSPDLDLQEPEDLAYAVRTITGEVPVDGWVSLAQSFLDRFEPRSSTKA
jgi:hypothetical protein